MVIYCRNDIYCGKYAMQCLKIASKIYFRYTYILNGIIQTEWYSFQHNIPKRWSLKDCMKSLCVGSST